MTNNGKRKGPRTREWVAPDGRSGAVGRMPQKKGCRLFALVLLAAPVAALAALGLGIHALLG